MSTIRNRKLSGFVVTYNKKSWEFDNIYEALYKAYEVDSIGLVSNKSNTQPDFAVYIDSYKADPKSAKEYFVDCFESAAELGYPWSVGMELLELLDINWNTQTDFERAVTNIMRNARMTY